jgi:hypothetical protein
MSLSMIIPSMTNGVKALGNAYAFATSMSEKGLSAQLL